MGRILLPAAAVLALLSMAISGYVWKQLEETRKRTEASIAELQDRVDQNGRQTAELEKQLAQAPTASMEGVVNKASVPQPIASATPEVPEAPIVTNSARDILATVSQCILSVRSLRCNLTVTNQARNEKKFILTIGGKFSRFEDDSDGTCLFDDTGNDFLSDGGGVGNRTWANCDQNDTCRIEKVLVPGVSTPAWVRFDEVDQAAASVKLLRLKWSDDDAGVHMDFRNIPISR